MKLNFLGLMKFVNLIPPNPTSVKEIEFIIKKQPTIKTSGWDCLTGEF